MINTDKMEMTGEAVIRPFNQEDALNEKPAEVENPLLESVFIPECSRNDEVKRQMALELISQGLTKVAACRILHIAPNIVP